MAKGEVVETEINVLRNLYAAFNRREIEAVLSAMDMDVDWPNGMEGGRELGKSAVRAYWRRQFEIIDPKVEPQGFTKEQDGRIAVTVHQLVRDKSGKLLVDQVIQHVYEFQDGLIRSMEIRSDSPPLFQK